MNKFKFPKFGEKEPEKHIVEQAEEKAETIKSDLMNGVTEMHKKFAQDTDTEFFICIAFQNREQKEEFIKAKGWDDLGDKYYSGLQIAEKEQITLTKDENMRKAFKFKPIKNTL